MKSTQENQKVDQMVNAIIFALKNILNIIVYKDFSLEQGLFWPRDLIMYKYKIFSLIFHDTGMAEMVECRFLMRLTRVQILLPPLIFFYMFTFAC